MGDNDVRITRPIHGEVGLFSIDVQPDGSVSLHIQTAKESDGIDLAFTPPEFAQLGSLIARVRKAQGSASKGGKPAKRAPTRRTKPTPDAPTATASEPAAANGVAAAIE